MIAQRRLISARLTLGLMTALLIGTASPAMLSAQTATTASKPAAASTGLSNNPGADAPEVKKAEAYLNNLRTLKARFVQTDNSGRRMTGDFLLKRPGRMRFQYDPPATDFIVADGIFVHYYDGQMKQQSSAPIGQSLANFFLRAEIGFTKDLRIETIGRDASGRMTITVTQAKDPLSGAITIIFNESDKGDLSLAGWRVLDPQGLTTDVALEQAQEGIKLPNDQFHYYDPKQGKPRYN